MRLPARNAAVATLLTASLALTGCASQAAPAADEETGSSPVEVDEGLLTVDLTIARSLLDPDGTKTDEELIAGAASKGIMARAEGDSVVYTMTKAQRDDMLAEMRKSARETVDEFVADPDNSFTAIDFDDEMTLFRVSVDASRYTPFEPMYALGFYMQGAMFQQFAGIGAEDVDVIVEFVDDATGEVLNTGSYQEMRANLAD